MPEQDRVRGKVGSVWVTEVGTQIILNSEPGKVFHLGLTHTANYSSMYTALLVASAKRDQVEMDVVHADNVDHPEYWWILNVRLRDWD